MRYHASLSTLAIFRLQLASIFCLAQAVTFAIGNATVISSRVAIIINSWLAALIVLIMEVTYPAEFAAELLNDSKG